MAQAWGVKREIVVMGSTNSSAGTMAPADGAEDHARHHADGTGLIGVPGEDADDHGSAGADEREEHDHQRGAEQVAPGHIEEQRRDQRR